MVHIEKWDDTGDRQLLIAKHSHSLESPYYFWLGYFLPIVNELRKNKIKDIKFFVRDCGPMNNWLDFLKNKYPIVIIKPGILLKYYLDNVPSVVFDYWDDKDRFERKEFVETVNFLKNEYTPKLLTNSKKIGILNRNKPLEFYNSEQQELYATSNFKRLIKNIDELKTEISKFYNCELIDTTLNSPEESINIYSNLNVLIGQFGAGLTNLLWMKKGSLIIEIIAKTSKTPTDKRDCYKKLSEVLGHKYIKVFAQDSWIGDVDINLIIETIQKENKLLSL